MKVVIDIILKIVQIIVMPVMMKFLDFLLKHFNEKYKKDEEFKKQVDEIRDKLMAKVNPMKLMQMYAESRAAAAKREQEKKKAAQEAAKREQEQKAAQGTPNRSEDASTPPESKSPDLTETAAETARLGYKATKQASKKAAGWLSHAGKRAGKWLKEETGITEDGSVEPCDGTDEDDEISRLKRRLQKDEQTKASPQPKLVDGAIPPTSPDSDTAPTRPVNPEDRRVPPRPENAEGEGGEDVEQARDPVSGYADRLEEMLRKQRENRDPDH